MGPFEAKYQLLNNRWESIGLKCFNDSRAFIEYSNDMDDIYKYIEESKLKKKRKRNILIVFDDIITIMKINLATKNLIH